MSLCLVGREQIRPDVEHVVFRLIDHPDPEVNPHLNFILTDIAETVAALRAEGHVVLLHCVAAQSRTPTAAIAYSLRLGEPLLEAIADLLRACLLPPRTPGSSTHSRS